MSALFTADIHLSEHARDAYRLDWCENRLPLLIAKHKCTSLIIGGDLTEAKHGHSAWFVNRIACWAKAMTTHVEEVIFYKGNHDYVDADDPFFLFLGLIPRVRFLSQPVFYPVPDLGECLFLPHTRDHASEWAPALDGLRKRRGPKPGYIFIHDAIRGGDMGNGREASGIPSQDLPHDCPVCAGDLHIPQDCDQVRYVGAPYTIDFGDNYESRVLVLKDYGVMKSVPIATPQKVLVDLGLNDDIERLDDIDTMKGDVVKVRVHVRRYSHDQWEPILAAVQSWAALRSVNLHACVPVSADRRIRRVIPAERKRKDDGVVLESFGKVRSIAEKTMVVGRRLMEKANG